jgi:Protein of unknown function (DUF2958)
MTNDTSLLTVEDQVRLLVNALDDGTDHQPAVKLFTPDGAATWPAPKAASSPDLLQMRRGIGDS